MCKVSFIVIGYNIESYIENCIKTIINQTLKEIEIIYVDDGSEDGTIYKIEKLAKLDERIKIIKQANSGANSARKNGLIHAKGEYILFIDGDDWVDINMARDLYTLTENKEIDIIAFSHYLAYSNSNCYTKKSNELSAILKEEVYLESILEQKISHNLWNKFFKRDFLIECEFLKIPSITMGDDLVANVQIGTYHPNVLVINEAYYYYYQRLASVTKKISPKILEIKIALNEIENILKKNNLFNKYSEQINYLWFKHAYVCLVVLSRHKATYIQRELYQFWKKKNINIAKNKYCSKYLKEIGYLKRLLIILYTIHYDLGYLFSRIFLKLRTK